MGTEAKGLEEVLTPERAEALEKTLDLLVRMKELGLLDVAGEILEPEVIGGLARLVMSPGLLKALDRLDEFGEALAAIDYEALEGGAELLNAALKSLPKEAKPVGLWGLLGAMRDPDFQRGLGFAVEFLKALGKRLGER